LSGGQKARIALARCVYSEADILLLDDPLSAVDSRVARQIFQRCLKPLSKIKTILLVTHQISFLHDCDELIVLQNGAITAQGSPAQLQRELTELSKSLKIEDLEDDGHRQ
jgi:ATP-binding cassette, subfamily C (CFTR/MRP), member 4